jgi:hypothetical protein
LAGFGPYLFKGLALWPNFALNVQHRFAAPLPGRLLLPYGLPRKFGLIGTTHVTTQHVKVAMAGDRGGLIFGTTCLNQSDRRRGA